MDQQDSLSPKAKFPARKKQNFQAKFAQLLQGQQLESEDGLDFAFDHNYSDIEQNENEMSQGSGQDSQQDLDYEDQIRDLKRRIMKKKEKQKKYLEREEKKRNQEKQFECYPYEEEKWKSGIEKSFDPDDLRLSRYQKKKKYSEEYTERESKREYSRESDRKRRNKMEKQKSYVKTEKESPAPRGNPPLSHKTSSRVSNKISNVSKKNKSQVNKIQSMITTSNYKKHMVFSAKLKLKKINFGSRKAGFLKFDIEYNNNFIPARKNHEINGYQTPIKEIFEVPFRAIYDRRKRQFYCEPIIVNVMNMHKRYNKRLGQLEVNVSGVLNRQQSYFNGQLKLKKTNDRQAKMEIVLTLKLEGIAEKEDVLRKEQYHFDDSYFSSNSDKYFIKIYFNW
jgi:hypothetical protein